MALVDLLLRAETAAVTWRMEYNRREGSRSTFPAGADTSAAVLKKRRKKREQNSSTRYRTGITPFR